jgi:hypothetical protein
MVTGVKHVMVYSRCSASAPTVAAQAGQCNRQHPRHLRSNGGEQAARLSSRSSACRGVGMAQAIAGQLLSKQRSTLVTCSALM